MNDYEWERRKRGFVNMVQRWAVQYHEAVAFLAGWSAYPIGLALLSLLGQK